MGTNGNALGRPRSETTRQLILKAAYDTLIDGGFGAFSIDGVASRAGVARTTIYRWWPSKGALAVECFLEHVLSRLAYKQSGSSVDDFRRLLRAVAGVMAGPDGRVVASILAEGQRDAETLLSFKTVYHQVLREHGTAVIEAGIERGEFEADVNPDVLLDAGVGAMYLNLLLQKPITDEWTAELIDRLLSGVAAKTSQQI